MTYNNLETQVTSVSGTWSSAGGFSISFSTLGLSTSIPFKDQIEVERIFSSSAFTAVKDNITTSDLHKIFLLEKTEYTITGNTISAFSMNSTRSYTLTGGSSSGTAIPIPAISNGDSVIIRRKTLSMDTYVTWAPGTKLTTTQLNQQVGQLLRLNQELIYKLDTEYVRAADLSGSVAPVLAVNNNLNMNSYQILNLETPASAVGSDLKAGANKGYVDTNFVNMSGNQTGIAGAKTFTGAITLSSGLTVDTNTLVVDATNDRVGIGTASPGYKLSVSSTPGLSGFASDGTVQQAFAYPSNTAAWSGTISNHAYVLMSNNTERMRILNTGDVGIGTTNPQAKLTVSTANPTNGIAALITNSSSTSHTGTQMQFTQNTIEDWVIGQPAGVGAFALWQARNTSSTGTERMRIDSNGNVGIGTTAPVAKLQVANLSPQYSPQIGTRQPGNQYEFGHSNAAGYGSVIGAEVQSGAPFIAFNCGAGTNNNTYRTFGLAGAVLKSDNAGGLNISTIASVNADNQSVPTDPTIAFTPTSTVVIGSSTKVTNASFSNGLKLEVITASTDGAVGLYHYGDSDAGNAIRSFRAKGSKASPTAVVSGNLLGSIRGLGYNGSAFTAQTGGMDIVTTENWTTGANGTAIAFNTTPNGSAAASMTKRMEIGQNGQVSMLANITSSSTTTGTLAVTGGVGLTGALYVGSVSVFNDNMTIGNNGLLQVQGEVNMGAAVAPSGASSSAGKCATISNANIGIYVITAGPPTFTAPKGSLCINTGGSSATTRLYINKDGGTSWAYVTAQN
jgi:hypothetical protein